MLNSKVLQVFYDDKCYPFKDKERSVRFPIIGNSFIGASNITEIRFYIDRIGSHEDSWVANSKLPNGKVGNQILTVEYDSEIDEYYAKLLLSSFYTQAKGDVYISLNGFYGGVTVTNNSGVYTISGIPTIQATGSIKLSVYYATPLIDGDEISSITLSQVLAEISTKVPKSSGTFIKVVSSISNINTSTYQDYLRSGDVVYAKAEKEFYSIGGTYPSLNYTAIELEISDIRVDDVIVNSECRIVGGASYLTFGQYGLESLQDYLDGKQDQIMVYTLTSHSGTINSAAVEALGEYPSYLYYGGNLFVHCSEDGDYHYFRKLFEDDFIDNSVNLAHGIVYVSLNKTTGAYTTTLKQYWFYSKEESDALLDAKADKSDTYTKNEIDTKLTSMLVYKGSKTVAELNVIGASLGENNTGWFYNVTDAGTLTIGSLEVMAGDNVCWTGSGWDKLTMDLSAYDDKFIAAGFFEVQNYDESTGIITFVYDSDLYDMSYDGNTGVLTIQSS